MAPQELSRQWRIRLSVLIVIVAVMAEVAVVRASGTGTPASAVLGEAVFDTTYLNTASSMLNPAQITIDSAGHFYMADLGDNRVLGWHSATGFANNAPADLVIGQVDFLHVYANQGGAVATASSLASPQGVVADSDATYT